MYGGRRSLSIDGGSHGVFVFSCEVVVELVLGFLVALEVRDSAIVSK